MDIFENNQEIYAEDNSYIARTQIPESFDQVCKFVYTNKCT